MGFLAQLLIYKTITIQLIIILGLKISMRYHYFLRKLNIFLSNGSINYFIHKLPIDLRKEISKVLDVLGRKTNQVTNMPVLFIYDDGTVEKRFQIKR